MLGGRSYMQILWGSAMPFRGPHKGVPAPIKPRKIERQRVGHPACAMGSKWRDKTRRCSLGTDEVDPQ